MAEKPLYQDEIFKIDYYTKSPGEHVLYIKETSRRELNFLLQRGVLEQLARTETGGLRQILDNIDPIIPFIIEENNTDINKVKSALSKAYVEEGKRRKKFMKTL